MSYELSFKHESDYLYVQATGTRNLENIVAMVKDFFAERDRHGYSNVLLDVRGMVGGLNTIETFRLGKKNLQPVRPPGQAKISVLDLEENRERFQYMEGIAINIGLILRIFTDVDKAITWLRVSKNPAGE